MESGFREQLNAWSKAQQPFIFIIDFEQQKPLAWPIEEVDSENVLYHINGKTNAKKEEVKSVPAIINTSPVDQKVYEEKFSFVKAQLHHGNSFLTNLTTKTKIQLRGTLRDCFFSSHAAYRLWLKDQFVVFSPEIFVKLMDGKIYSYPMKGTLDAALPNAQQVLLNDEKEIAEHVTIVDLIRNDLSTVAEHVKVNRFRYVQEVRSRERTLLQVSSEIEGVLREEYRFAVGDLLEALLPSGSVSGAPKEKTVKIIAEAEGEPRGYYTGVCGYFDGQHLDSGVMIRFIEQRGNDFYYRSGGGITTQSEVGKEFDETLAKIYVPVD